MPDEQEKDRAKDQARSQLDSVVQMVKRLKHAQECDGGEDCDLTDEEIFAGTNIFYQEGMKASEEERESYHNEDDARQSMDEDPLSVQVRSDWHTPGENEEAAEYEILLCTGGPAVRTVGELDEYQQPDTAKIEYQDWFTPWEHYGTTTEEDEALLSYARQFYFGS